MFKVGQRVVCVDDKQDQGLIPTSLLDGPWIPPRLGRVYTISAIGKPNPFYPGQLVVHLAEQRNAVSDRHRDYGYLARRFEPLPKKKTSIEIFTRILTSLQEKIDG